MPSESKIAAQSVNLYHDLFGDAEADTILQSLDGTLFRVPGFVLRGATAHFAATLPVHADARPIPVDAPDPPLVWVLSILCGLEPPETLSNFDAAEAALSLAERWSAPGPIARARDAVAHPAFPADPLRLYALSTRFGWADEARLAVRGTLALALYDIAHETALRRLSASNLLALLALHRRRRDELDRILSGENPQGLAPANVNGSCAKCGLYTNSSAWREYRARVFMEMDKRPLGDTVIGFAVDDWREATACWDVKCQGEGCGGAIYDKDHILRRLKECIEALPDTV